ncbi:unnamed protein product [Fraxinus pennsylvanica]|uniref:DUF7731 domain-containing protein n=1 Tax=Fraxinus pennsylvanica TaxID=56036 RepID=A0AAD1ZA37_9LAMI|nr:unnamed protein product [Fraxinus pennsylvanica]
MVKKRAVGNSAQGSRCKSSLEGLMQTLEQTVVQMQYLTSKRWFLATVLVYIFVSSLKLGKAYEDHPHLGAAGVIAKEFLPRAEDEGETDQYFPQAGIINTNPANIVDKALECFHDNYIYSSCDETYRLSQIGELNVPPEYTDQYCKGPCLTETHHVLDCLDGITKHTIFYNKATLSVVRETIKTGCSYGPKRGDFSVAEHLQAEENSARTLSKSVIYGLLLMFMTWGAFF